MALQETTKSSYEIEFSWNASHVSHNLFSWRENGQVQLASCHRNLVQMASLTENDDNRLQAVSMRESALSDGSATIIQAKVVEIESQLILVIINENNIQFHDVVRNMILYTYIPQSRVGDDLMAFETPPPQSVLQTSDEEDKVLNTKLKNSFIEPFARGIGHIKFFIFIGLSDGCILVMSRLEDGCITYEDTICPAVMESEKNGKKKRPIDRTLGPAITDISTDTNQGTVVTGDCSGGLKVYEPEGTAILRLLLEFEGFNQFPCTGVRVCGNVVISSYGSGHLRVFGLIQGRLLSEVHAHLAWINCIDSIQIRNSEYQILTGSDDSMIRLWSVSDNYPWIRHEKYFNLKNRMITGVCFLNQEEDTDNDVIRFAAAAYDSCKITIFES